MKRMTLLTLILLLAIAGCEKKKDTPIVAEPDRPAAAVALEPPAPKMIFGEPMTARTFELPSEALQAWRHVREIRPPLVLFSIHPFLDPVAEEQRGDIAALIRSGDAAAFSRRGSFYRVKPALAPTQVVSAAIDNGIFSEIIWVIPTRVGIDEISLDVFRRQLVDAGFLTDEEGSELSFFNGVFSGTVRGLPFRAVHPDALPDLAAPVVLHVDTGYFKGMFKNEVATPLYDVLFQTVMRILQAEWNVYAVTLSWSTEELMFSLDVRFLISALAEMIEDPQLVRDMPPAWKLHSEAMYLGNMYLETKSRDLIEEAAVTAPDEPAIVYALSQVRFQQGRNDEAFTLLDRAVQLDPGYGAAYLQLAETGLEKGEFVKALELQRKAVGIYPENPFLRIGEADILIRMGRSDEALAIIRDLKKLPWSEAAHPNAVADLDEMAEYAKNPQASTPVTAEEEKR